MIPTISGIEASIPLWGIVAIMIWTAIWKGIGLWRAGNQKQLAWFVVMFVLNTAGILPIVYLVWFQKKSSKPVRAVKESKKKRR
jgi:methionyl-tRNA synthetase